MSEELPEIPLVDLPDQDQAGWEQVAQEMHAWHPGLQELAMPHLEARGLTPLQPTDPEIPDIVNSSSEQPPTSSEEITISFDKSLAIIRTKLLTEPVLQDRLKAAGLHPYKDRDKSGYWGVVAGYVSERVAAGRQRSGEGLPMSTLELLALTPQFAFEQANLDNKVSADGSAEQRRSSRIVTEYGAAIRDFAEQYSETRVSDLQSALENMLVRSLPEGHPILSSASAHFRQTLRGAQHELGFGQQLSYTNHEYWPATAKEDGWGTDYFVVGGNNRETKLDVKASLHAIETEYGVFGKAWARRSDGTVVIFSLLKDEQFHDRFFVTEETAQHNAPVLERLLSEIELRAA